MVKKESYSGAGDYCLALAFNGIWGKVRCGYFFLQLVMVSVDPHNWSKCHRWVTESSSGVIYGRFSSIQGTRNILEEGTGRASEPLDGDESREMPASEHDSVVAHIDSAAMIPTQTFTGSSQSKFWPGCVSGGVTGCWWLLREGGRVA